MASNLSPPINPGVRPPSMPGRYGSGPSRMPGGARSAGMRGAPKPPYDPNMPPPSPPEAFDPITPRTRDRSDPKIQYPIGPHLPGADPTTQQGHLVNPYADLYGFQDYGVYNPYPNQAGYQEGTEATYDVQGRLADPGTPGSVKLPKGYMSNAEYAAYVRGGGTVGGGAFYNVPGSPDKSPTVTGAHGTLNLDINKARAMSQLMQQRDAGKLRGLTSVEGQGQNRQLTLPPELMAARLRREGGGGY